MVHQQLLERGRVSNTRDGEQTWDDTSRLTSQIDDNGNATTYVYDGLNRKGSTIFADGTGQTNQFDAHHTSARFTDANGNIVSMAYDADDRLLGKDVVCGPGVATNTTFEVFKYDGAGRLVHAEDNGSLIKRIYDSLSQMVAEVQNDQVVSSVFDGVGNRTQCTYPSTRVITEVYDSLERKTTIADSTGLIATYSYAGPGRVAQRDYGNGTRAAYSYDGITGAANAAGDFGVRQITRTRHTRISDASTIDDRSYAWDRVGDKTEHHDLRLGGFTHSYTYDSNYRLVRSVKAPVVGGAEIIAYNLDGVGNRRSVVGGTNAGNYTLTGTLPEPADFQLNQYTSTPFGSRNSDRDGNLIRIDAGQPTERNLVFDYRNRLVAFTNQGLGAISMNSYDTLGRRIAKTVSGGAGKTLRFLYDGLRICEDRAEGTISTYTYGLFIDEILTMRAGGQTFYYHCDELYSVSAISDFNGAVVERFDYDDFGMPLFFDSSGTLTSRSASSNPWLFTGRRYDAESGLYVWCNSSAKVVRWNS